MSGSATAIATVRLQLRQRRGARRGLDHGSRARRGRRNASVTVRPSAAANTSPREPRAVALRDAREGDERVDFVVGARRVVVEQREPADVAGHRDVDRVLDGAVTPPDLGRVLLLEVLRVVDERGRRRVRTPTWSASSRSERPRRRAGERARLVVGRVHERSRRRPRCGNPSVSAGWWR